MKAPTFKLTLLATTLAAALCAPSLQAGGKSPFTISIEPISTYATGVFAQSAAEIVAHDPKSQRLFVVNALSGKIDVLDVRDAKAPSLHFSIDLAALDGTANSVAVHKGIVAVAVESSVRTNNGKVAFFNTDGDLLTTVNVGALPDMLTFTPNGRHLLVANEGEPSTDYLVDPEGSVSIIDLPRDIRRLKQSDVRTATFTRFNNSQLDPAIRIFGPNASVAQDLEPEYIAVDKESRTAWVTLQENNAFAVLDIAKGRFTEIQSLGFKNHLLPGNGLDVSDRDNAIAIRNWPVMGMYMPDAVASYDYRGKTYIVSANEGDARDYEGYAEESRFRALSGETPPCEDSPRLQAFFADNPMGITTLSQLRDNDFGMGRLTVTTATGLREDGSCYEDIYAYGARSFSIWRGRDLKQVYDSGDDFERITAEANPEFFNSNHEENEFDNRSDNKGPEPEGVAIAKLWGSTYAFIGLERVGGVMIYDISNPYAPHFVQYLNNRDFSADPTSAAAGDLGAEGLTVIEAKDSPIRGVPLLVVANEVSGTTTLYRIDREKFGKHYSPKHGHKPNGKH